MNALAEFITANDPMPRVKKLLQVTSVSIIFVLIIQYWTIIYWGSYDTKQTKWKPVELFFQDNELSKGHQSTTFKNAKAYSFSSNLPLTLDELDKSFGVSWHWEWIKSHLHATWQDSYNSALKLYPNLQTRRRLNIIVVPGFLTTTNLARPSVAFHGGPVGELTQWADLIGALYTLGHRVIVLHELGSTGIGLRAYMRGQMSDGCATSDIDLIFTDIPGCDHFPTDVQHNYRWKIRILDVYGTEVMYNNAEYAQAHGAVVGAGGHNFCPQQFYTMYPTVPDNSFLGFIVHPPNISIPSTKLNNGIIYGKERSYLLNNQVFIKALQEHMEIHCTVNGPLPGLPGVVQHGVLSRDEYKVLMSNAKFFIGMGDPVEGPGAVEALSYGLTFIQPKFTKPRKLYGKPNNRTLRSQVDYLTDLGPPWVLTIDYNNISELHKVLQAAVRTKVTPHVPHAFTAQGFTERLAINIHRQQFCGRNLTFQGCFPNQSTSSAIHIVPSPSLGTSCTDTCKHAGYVCSYDLFPQINNVSSFTSLNMVCTSTIFLSDVYFPAFMSQSKTCVLQQDYTLFSCNSYGSRQFKRLCPCIENNLYS